MRWIAIGVVLMAAAVDVAGAARPAVTVLVPPPIHTARRATLTQAPTAGTEAASLAQGWLVATVAFGLLGFGMRTRRRVRPHSIG